MKGHPEVVELEAVAACSYYDATGARVLHAPGERFTLVDGQTIWTARQLADTLIAANLAIPAPPKPAKKAK